MTYSATWQHGLAEQSGKRYTSRALVEIIRLVTSPTICCSTCCFGGRAVCLLCVWSGVLNGGGGNKVS